MASKAYEYNLVMQTPFNVQKWDVNSKEDSRIKRSLTSKAKISLIAAVIIMALIIIVLVVCLTLPKENDGYAWPSYTSNSRLGRYPSSAISTDSPPCAPIGRDILQRNGSVIDAAIAVLACMGAYNPESMGLGGGFLMLYYNRTEKEAHYMDSRETAPLNATKDMYHGNGTLKTTGGLSIAVPGELAGYAEAHRMFGRLPWKDLFTPTIEMCKKGVEVSEHLAVAIRKERESIMKFKHLGDVFLKNGTEPYLEGERIKMPALARTLEIIARQKMKALYGPSALSDSFVEDLKAAGSIIGKTDLQSYSPRLRKPVKVVLRNSTTLYSASIPGSGALVGLVMSILGGYQDFNRSVEDDEKASVLAYHRMVEAFKFAYAHRNLMEDEDNGEMEELLENLQSPEYAADIRSRIDDSRTYDEPSHYGAQFSFTEDHGTAHMSIVAPNGDAVSVTSTINTYFGSKVLSPSTGVILNNEMDDFSSPNIVNYFDLPPTKANNVRPGKRPMSSMTPTIVVDAQGDVRLVLGGNGGTSITTGVIQVAARNLLLGEDIKQSIDAPRIHHQLMPNIVHHEVPFPQKMVAGLQKLGHRVEPWTKNMMSIIMGIERGEDGYIYANADYRKKGEVDGF